MVSSAAGYLLCWRRHRRCAGSRYPAQLNMPQGLEWCLAVSTTTGILPRIVLLGASSANTGIHARCWLIWIASVSAFIIRTILLLWMPFLSQPYKFILAWKRHRVMLNCIHHGLVTETNKIHKHKKTTSDVRKLILV